METWKILIIVFSSLTAINIFVLGCLMFYEKPKKILITFSCSLSVFILCIIISLVGYNKAKVDYKNEYKSEVIYYLASFEEGEKLEGNFWLYFGRIDEQQIYKYYIITDNGYQLKYSYVTDDTYVREIKENQNIKPCYTKEKIAGSLDWIYVFYIPQGSLFE